LPGLFAIYEPEIHLPLKGLIGEFVSAANYPKYGKDFEAVAMPELLFAR
jgi:hypothetical protein